MIAKNILLPIYNTIHESTLFYAKDLAIQNNATLFIVYITNPLTFTNTYSHPSLLYSISNMNMEGVKLANQSISNKLDTFLDNVEYELIFLIGSPVDLIVDVTKEKGIDLIVLPPKNNPFAGGLSGKINKISKKVNIPIVIFDTPKQA